MGHSQEEEVNLTPSIFGVTSPILCNSNRETTQENKWKDQCSSGITEMMPSFSKYRLKLNVRCKSAVNTNLGLLRWQSSVRRRQLVTPEENREGEAKWGSGMEGFK